MQNSVDFQEFAEEHYKYLLEIMYLGLRRIAQTKATFHSMTDILINKTKTSLGVRKRIAVLRQAHMDVTRQTIETTGMQFFRRMIRDPLTNKKTNEEDKLTTKERWI